MLRGEEGGFLQEYKGPQREKMENMMGTLCGFYQDVNFTEAPKANMMEFVMRTIERNRRLNKC